MSVDWRAWGTEASHVLAEVAKGPCARGREGYVDCVWTEDAHADDPDACLRCRAAYLLDCLLEAAPGEVNGR